MIKIKKLSMDHIMVVDNQFENLYRMIYDLSSQQEKELISWSTQHENMFLKLKGQRINH